MLFTIFTPIYNGRDTLERVWDSLAGQTERDFEWVVVDDGSTDGVEEDLLAYAERADFPVRVMGQRNRGKFVAWNRAVEVAQGELFVPADADDAFVPETLARFRDLWRTIPAHRRHAFSGVNVLCRSATTGRVMGRPFPRSPMVSDNLALRYLHRVTSEKWGCVRTDLLRRYPFPEVEGTTWYPLSRLWHQLAQRYRVLCVNEELRIYFDVAGSLSKFNPVKFARSAPVRCDNYLWELNTNLRYLRRDKLAAARMLVGLWRTAYHAGLRPREVRARLQPGARRLWAAGAWPLGWWKYRGDRRVATARG